MPDLYIAKKSEEKKSMEKRSERKSVTQLKTMVEKMGGDTLFTSFASFPKHICFQTQEDEEAIVLFMRQHFLVNIPWIVLSIFMLTLPSVFAFFPPYAALPTGMQFVVSLGWYLFVSGYTLAKLMGWFFNIYIVTDERIVDVDFKNIFFRKISTAKIEEIQDINVQASGSFETFFGYGSVFIQTAAEVPEFEFVAIPHPDRVGKILNQLIDHEEQEKIEGRVNKMETLAFLDSFSLMFFVKFLLVTLLSVYAIFALLMMKQINAMTRAVTMQDDYIIRGLGALHFGLAVIVWILSLLPAA